MCVVPQPGPALDGQFFTSPFLIYQYWVCWCGEGKRLPWDREPVHLGSHSVTRNYQSVLNVKIGQEVCHFTIGTPGLHSSEWWELCLPARTEA